MTIQPTKDPTPASSAQLTRWVATEVTLENAG